MLRTFSKSVWSQLQPAEWVCLGFVVLSALRVLTTSSPLGAGVTSWMQFPRLDLMAAAFAVLTLKLTRKNRPVTILILVTLVACFFGIAGISADAVLPIPHALGPTIFNTLAAIRWWLLAALAGVFALTISKNPDSRATALDGLRAIFPLFLMTCLYPLAPILIRAAGAPDRDAQLQWLDSAIFLGHDPLLIAERWISPALSEWMTLSYTAYGLIFLAVFAMLFVKKDLQPFAKLIFATTLALALGYLGYTLVPAVGPMFARTFSTPVDLHYLKELKESLIDRTRIERDCFPSLHTAITLIAASFAWRNLKPLFWILAPFAVTVPLACVYLRYHYVVDVLAGIALAAFAIVTSERVLRKSEARASRSR